MAKRKAKKAPKPNKPYTLPSKARFTEKRVLSLDPGSKNMGIACVGMRKGKVRVLANAIMMNPFTSLASGVVGQKETFLKEIDAWVKLYKPTGIIMERFQSRGGMGPLIELVSVMLGVILARYNMPIKFITAATWKNAYRRRFGEVIELDDMYDEILTTPHQLDATLIGCYGLDIGIEAGVQYSPAGIMHQVEKTSLLPLKKRRKQ